MKQQYQKDRSGSVAERSKALDLGSSLFGGVGSNPITASCAFYFGYRISPGAKIQSISLETLSHLTDNPKSAFF